MSDTFFTQTNCDRCKKPLTGTRIMSKFNKDCICEECLKKEKAHPKYKEASDAELKAVQAGDYDFPGIGLPDDLKPSDERITFRLYASIKFDRPIDKEKHYISPGGYTMTFRDRTFRFDFEGYEGYIDEEDKSILHFKQINPDYDVFGESDYEGVLGLNEITSDDLKNLTAIDEFFIYTGESDEAEINPVKFLEFAFEDFGTASEVRDDVIDYTDNPVVKDYVFD